MQKIKDRIIDAFPIFVIIYMIIWMTAVPFFGTMRCQNWVVENGEYKCNEVKAGLLNPLYKFDSTMPR